MLRAIFSRNNQLLTTGIVEMMAAGLMTIAHRSGGPLMDIVVEDTGARNGFLAITSQEYAAHIAYIINMTEEVKMRTRIIVSVVNKLVCRLGPE